MQIEIGPLSVGALRELLRRVAAPCFPGRRSCASGRPRRAIRSSRSSSRRALQRRGATVRPGEELPLPSSLDEIVHERVELLGPQALDVARVVAALADPEVTLVEAAAGHPTESGLDDAIEARILEIDGERLRFTHPLLRSAVWSRATPAQRRSLHARLAPIAPSTEERARHLALATAEPSREVAAVVDEAGESAHARGAPAAAAELAELAVRLTPAEDVDDARRRILELADRLRAAGDGDRAIALLEQARSKRSSGPVRAAALVHLAGAVASRDDLRRAVDLHSEALGQAHGDAALEAEIHLNLAGLVMVTEEQHGGLAHAELAVEAASRAADAELRCRALANYGFLHFRGGQGIPRTQMEEAFELERSLPQGRALGEATSVLAFQLVWSGELDRARRLLEDRRAALNAREDPRRRGRCGC